MSQGAKARALPKFGEWDVTNPASSEGFTVIFNKARDQKKNNGTAVGGGVPTAPAQKMNQDNSQMNNGYRNNHGGNQQPHSRKWLCCFYRA